MIATDEKEAGSCDQENESQTDGERCASVDWHSLAARHLA